MCGTPALRVFEMRGPCGQWSTIMNSSKGASIRGRQGADSKRLASLITLHWSMRQEPWK